MPSRGRFIVGLEARRSEILATVLSPVYSCEQNERAFQLDRLTI